jgi:hypothetical protein
MSQETAARPKTVKVTVTFPISPAGPLLGDRPATESVGALREEAMTHFGVAPDGQHTYYLTHASRKVEDSETIGQVAGSARSAKFTLVKELVQGG